MSKLILLIDDNHRLTAALKIRLQAAGYRVVTADCGEAGLELARRDLPDLIVLDIRMPGMDGIEVCRTIRSDADLARTPVLVLSAVELESSRRAVMESGADQLLSKPYEAVNVLAAIGSLLKSRYDGQENPEQGPSAERSAVWGGPPHA